VEKKNNIVDFFSGKNMDKLVEKQDRPSENALNQYGRYLGVLHSSDARTLRDQGEYLARFKGQIDEMLSRFEQEYGDYIGRLGIRLKELRLPKNLDFMAGAEIYIDQDGHTWAVAEKDWEAFIEAVKASEERKK
jgi:hypothetical protein